MNPVNLLDAKMNTLMTRIEMFVEERQWKESEDNQFKKVIYSLVQKIEAELKESILREWNI